MPDRPKTIHDLLWNNPMVRDRLARRQRELELLEAARQRVPGGLQRHCIDAHLEDTTLVLVLDSPAWATRARFLARDLGAALAARDLTAVRIQTRPPQPQRQHAPKAQVGTPRRLSAATVEHLRTAAEHLDDPELAATLRRLAEHHAEDDTSSD
ncbi:MULTISPECIES: DciA family protein [Marichromatium]|uniref:Uncharacterized protein DUF721 n=1 Tax=Marichromatium gracile TaxID=1048 RepID=A0A4R4AG50_MARGR|nr:MULTISPECIES: DciA family protein [Marichromatium]MBO8084420.1 DUF721 domain-containing protein [Marichromatium sp.]MBK1709280.1 hypothetical protein [Marichromatium gracile]RNE90842.1 DUF721 domain-containing protein [Marichromatium sp. AB31]RNE94385.1 DUF721 domain-containing protein [Marichromatium sp. AB32]TCW38212.1 uncharacterized protein DUF721 [Marichromatium gracile]